MPTIMLRAALRILVVAVAGAIAQAAPAQAAPAAFAAGDCASWMVPGGGEGTASPALRPCDDALLPAAGPGAATGLDGVAPPSAVETRKHIRFLGVSAEGDGQRPEDAAALAEPGSLAVFGFGLVALGLAHRRLRRRRG